MTVDINQVRAEALQLLDERDMRFFDGTDVYNGPVRTAGDAMRLYMREPLLDEAGAKAFADATRQYAIPAWTLQDLYHFMFCARRCPRKGVRA